MNIKSIRIMKCIDSDLWYFNREGETFRYSYTRGKTWYSYEREAWVDGFELMVIDNEGRINSVGSDDGRLILGV